MDGLSQDPRFSVVACLRRPPTPQLDTPWRLADATDEQAIAAALDGCDVAVNAVGGPPQTLLAATEALCRMASRAGLRRLVHISSMSVYAARPGLACEDWPMEPAPAPYAAAKIASEAAVRAYTAAGGSAVSLRAGIVFGPHSTQWSARIARLLRAGRLGDLGPAGDGFCNLTHEADLAAAVGEVLLAEQPPPAFNLSTLDPPTWNLFFEVFARALRAVPVGRIGARRLAFETAPWRPPCAGPHRRPPHRSGGTHAAGRDTPLARPPVLAAVASGRHARPPCPRPAAQPGRARDRRPGRADARVILDAASFQPGHVGPADLCIVGAGAAGIALALQFEHTRTNVVGAGSRRRAVRARYPGLAEGRTGASLPPSPARHSTAAPFRRRPRPCGAAAACRSTPSTLPRAPGCHTPAGRSATTTWKTSIRLRTVSARRAIAHTPHRRTCRPILRGFAGAHFTDDRLERFSCPTDFAARYRARLHAAPNIRVVLHANITRIATGEDGRVSAIEASTLAGRKISVRAHNYVLAAGGLEVPRLLLASRGPHHPNGIGNAHDLVGRFYMCHLAGTLGTVHPSVPVEHGYALSEEGIYCRRRFALTAAAQRRLRTGNMVARLHHPRIGDPSHRSGALSSLVFAAPLIAREYATRLQDGGGGPANLLRHAGNIAATPRHTAEFLLHWLRHRTLATRKFPSIIVRPPAGVYTLDVHAEQLPHAASRVTLAQDTDALGTPRLQVDWRHLEADIETVRTGLRALAADFTRSGTARLDWDEISLEADLLRDGAYGGHHLGTARMADDPRHGVVDSHCRVHGAPNLWIAGGAVFPTSGQANPTLTIVALALRLAARLGAPATHGHFVDQSPAAATHLPHASLDEGMVGCSQAPCLH